MTVSPPCRPTRSNAGAIMIAEIERVGGGYRNDLVRTDQPRAEAKVLDWWYSGNVESEGSITPRTIAYLRAYLAIAGNGQLHAAGLLLDQGRVHMDKYVVRRLHADGYLAWNDSRTSPYFSPTEKGLLLAETGEISAAAG